MKYRSIYKILFITFVILLALGAAASFYMKMTVTEKAEDLDLYSMVPSTSVAVLDTDDMVNFVNGVNNMSCSKDNNFLFVSRLFSYLKDHVNTLLDDVPHGLSQQMRRILISFHEPDNEWNQVFYCRLGVGDHDFVERFITKYSTSVFPSKYFDYHGEEIRIYPMSDDKFLSCYLTSEFLVVSFQKKLIEEVIDARLEKKSLLDDKAFAALQAKKKHAAQATIYARTDTGEAKQPGKGEPGSWTEFNMKMNADAIYFSGINYDQDSLDTFMNVLRKQKTIEGFPGDELPLTTFYLNRVSVSDIHSFYSFTSQREYSKAYSSYILNRDMDLYFFLQDHANHSITASLFWQADTVPVPCTVLSIPVKNMYRAEQAFRNMLRIMPPEEDVDLPPDSVCQVPSGKYTLAAVPRNTIFAQLTRVTNFASHLYACFYNGKLLMSPNPSSLVAYMSALDKSETLEGDSLYEEGTGSLSQSYNFILMGNLGDIFRLSGNHVRLIPDFFYNHQNFFKHFALFSQFTSIDGVIYPNIVFIYKG